MQATTKRNRFDDLIMVRLPKTDRRKAEALATLTGVSLSELARQGLREKMQRFLGGKESDTQDAAV